MSFSVKNKIFSIFVIVILLAVSVIGWFGFKSAKESYIDAALSNNDSRAKALSREIQGILETIPGDVAYNANFYALEKLLIWEELKDHRKIKYWESVYISALKGYILNKKLYYQIRILDIHGHEKLQLKYDEKTDSVVRTPDDELQNRAHRNYFKKALKLKKDEFYISEMGLNTEYGKIEKPFVPVVRYSTPLIDNNGEIKGVIVLNLNANNILKEVAAAKVIDKRQDSQMYYLLNENGYYLFIGDESKRWGFQLGTDFNFKKDYKGVLEEFKNKDEITLTKDKKIFSMYKIYPNKSGNKDRFWYLVTGVQEDVALASLDTFINVFFIILFVVLGLGLFVINWYISKLMNPLAQVTLQLKALSDGEIKKEQIAYTSKDEIGQIVTSTNILVDAIETTIHQANSVANGDFSKEIQLLSKNDSLGLAIKDMTARLKEITALSTTIASGNYDVNIVIKNSEDKLGLALVEMVKYLETITNITESIAVGDLDVKYKAKGEDDRLGRAILQMIKYLKAILKQANAISKEDFSSSIESKSSNDELGLAIVKMTDMLRDSSVKNKNEIYFNEGVSEFSDKIAGINDIVKLSKEAITTISRYVDASSGVVYIYDKEIKELSLVASFSYISRNKVSNNFKLGEGVVGQVALEKEAILLKNIKDEDFYVQSATTISTPKEVYTFPLIHEDELFGVVELMNFSEFSKMQKDYFSKIAVIFAGVIHTANQNTQIKVLLEKSQQAFEELQTQSEELQESNVQMEEQQQQLTLQSKELVSKNNTLAIAKQEIDKRAEELEKASKYKSEFLANMSHELRTPLNSIILLSKLLSKNQNETLSKKDIEKTDVIHKAGNDLLLLINDILDLSKIESGNMELVYEDTQSSDILKEMQGLFEAVAEDKNLNFIVLDEFKKSFSTDKVKLLQVLKNLLSNAFKFTKTGSVSLEIHDDIERVKIIVKDSGIGIPQNKLETIFEAFKQVDGSISREFGGTGLGLSISKTIIDLMNGTIDVQSKEGEGASFIVYLPLHELSTPHAMKSPHATNPHAIDIEDTKTISPHAMMEKHDKLKTTAILQDEELDEAYENEFIGKNILIVDDDSRNIFALTSTLESMDAEVYSAFNGKEALDILDEEQSIDLILMDIMMPVMDGLVAIKNIKMNENYKDIPIIAITAKTMPQDKQQCLDAGADDYLAKPLESSALVSMMKAWMR